MKLLRNAFCAALLFSLAAGCSTDAICEDACAEWESCTQVEGNYVNYSWDECWDDCKSEGDWTRGYVNCLEEQTTCPALGNQCE